MFIMSLVFENDNKQIASTYQNKTRQLLSLTDSNKSETKGIYVGTPIFSYGVVSKKDQMYYRVIAGNEKVGYRVKEFDVYKTPLFFIDEKELPKTEEVYKIIKYRKVGNFLFGVIIKMSEKSRTFENKVFIENRLYIPKSAVKIEFNVDGKWAENENRTIRFLYKKSERLI